jgi:dCMP deaminase
LPNRKEEKTKKSKEIEMNFDEYFVSMLYLVAMKSKDIKTQNGTIIVSQDNRIKSTGYNSFPSGINDYISERQERPEKYFWFEHGERNALYSAARAGIKLEGCRLYVTGIPCMDCARGIVQCGIKEVIYHVLKPYDSKLWEEHHKRTLTLFKEAGIKIREYKGEVTSNIQIRRDGEIICL